nr:putative integral membrane protein [Kibdelosporangium sp. MJ126-NF4]
MWIYDLPNWALFVLFTGAAIGLSWSAVFLLRPVMTRLFQREEPDQRNGLFDMVLSGTGLFYGLLLGLIAAATYSSYVEAEDTVNAEASVIATLHRDITGYPEPLRGQLHHDLESYVAWVIDEAWPQQRQGIEPTAGVARATAMLDRLIAFEPVTEGQKVVHAETFTQFNKFIDLRRQRLNDVAQGLPGPLWVVIGLGAAINLVLLSMLAVGRVAAHLLISGLFAVFVAMMIFLIASMDNPFRGEFSIAPTAFEKLQQNLFRR